MVVFLNLFIVWNPSYLKSNIIFSIKLWEFDFFGEHFKTVWGRLVVPKAEVGNHCSMETLATLQYLLLVTIEPLYLPSLTNYPNLKQYSTEPKTYPNLISLTLTHNVVIRWIMLVRKAMKELLTGTTWHHTPNPPYPPSQKTSSTYPHSPLICEKHL